MIQENQKRAQFKITDVNFLLFVAFFVNIICFSYQHINAEYTLSNVFASGDNVATLPRNNYIVSFLVLVMMLCFFFASILSLTGKKRINSTILCVLILMVSGILWTILAVQKSNIVTVVKSPVSPFVLIMSVLVFLGYNEQAWETIKKFTFIFSIVYTIISAYEMMRFVSDFGFSNRLMLSGAIYGIIVVIFFTYFNLLFNDGLIKKHKIIIPIQLLLIVSITIILQSRSWVVHAIILLLIYIVRLSKSYKNKIMYFIIISIIIAVILVLGSDYLITISGGLLDRMDHDSRTGQLEAFFSQVSFKDLMIGGGMQAGYSCFGNPNYQYLDNLVLLTLFKYGIIPTLSYLMLLIVPIIYGFRNKYPEARKAILFFIPWILIMLGLGIFVSYSNNIYNYLIYVVIGRFAFLREKDRKERAWGQLTIN